MNEPGGIPPGKSFNFQVVTSNPLHLPACISKLFTCISCCAGRPHDINVTSCSFQWHVHVYHYPHSDERKICFTIQCFVTSVNRVRVGIVFLFIWLGSHVLLRVVTTCMKSHFSEDKLYFIDEEIRTRIRTCNTSLQIDLEEDFIFWKQKLSIISNSVLL